MSLRTALVLALVAAVVATAGVLGGLEFRNIQASVMREAQARVDHGLRVISDAHERRLALTADRLANRAREARLEGVDAAAELHRIQRDLGFSVLNLCDTAGRPLAGTFTPGAAATAVASDGVLRRALHGDRAWGTVLLDAARIEREGGRALAEAIVVREAGPGSPAATTQALFSWYAVPVEDADGRLVALLYGGRALNLDDDLVDELRALAFGDETHEGKPLGTVTLFLRDVRVATNVVGPGGGRAVGTRVSPEVARQVLELGRPWSDRAWVVDAWYLSGYAPLRDPDGAIVGMRYLGLLEAPYAAMRRELISRSALTAAVLVLAALVFGVLLVRGITRPLEALDGAAHRIAAGDWERPVDDAPTYTELADLKAAFRRMQEALAERGRLLREQNAELARTNARLAETNANYMKMLGFVTHELKSPTAAVQMLIDGLMQSYGDRVPEGVAPMLTRIKRNCEEMQDMIRDYLDLSRAERGELVVRSARIDLGRDVVEPAVSLNRSLLLSREIELESSCPAGLALDADPELLRILVGNLLSNAAKYGRAGGRARLEAAAANGGVEVTVWNEGPGFTGEERAELFKKFSRIRNAATRDKRGSGLGLYLCKEIVELHGGAIVAESEPGAWARFRFTLPRAAGGG